MNIVIYDLQLGFRQSYSKFHGLTHFADKKIFFNKIEPPQLHPFWRWNEKLQQSVKPNHLHSLYCYIRNRYHEIN